MFRCALLSKREHSITTWSQMSCALIKNSHLINTFNFRSREMMHNCTCLLKKVLSFHFKTSCSSFLTTICNYCNVLQLWAALQFPFVQWIAGQSCTSTAHSKSFFFKLAHIFFWVSLVLSLYHHIDKMCLKWICNWDTARWHSSVEGAIANVISDTCAFFRPLFPHELRNAVKSNRVFN